MGNSKPCPACKGSGWTKKDSPDYRIVDSCGTCRFSSFLHPRGGFNPDVRCGVKNEELAGLATNDDWPKWYDQISILPKVKLNGKCSKFRKLEGEREWKEDP